jgi:CubicO group peptidase (beta-lactamase class C family)
VTAKASRPAPADAHLGFATGLGKNQTAGNRRLRLRAREQSRTRGQPFHYSDINFIYRRRAAREQPSVEIREQEIYRPLKLNDTRYRPWARDTRRIAPTERDEHVARRMW